MAEATVIGRIYDTVSVDVGRGYEHKMAQKSLLYSCKINFFKFSLNIFKRYGNLHNEYDIIENEIKCSLFDRCKLPLSITLKYIPQYTYENGVYTDDQLVEIASSRLMSLIALRLENSDLIRIKTRGNFTNTGYTMSTEIVFISDVAERVKFEIIK